MKKMLSIILASAMLTGICASAAEQKTVIVEAPETAAADLPGGMSEQEYIELTDEEAAEFKAVVDSEKGNAFLSEAEEPAEFFSICKNSDYAYRDAAKRSNGEGRQELYMNILKTCRSFETDRRDLTAYRTGSNKRNWYYLDYISTYIGSSEATEVYFTFKYDHPEFYWLCSGVSSGGGGLQLYVSEEYALGETRRALDEEMDKNIADVLSDINSQSFCCDYERINYINNLFHSRASYAYGSDGEPSNAGWAHSISGIFDSDRSTNVVCEGFSKAAILIFNALGIKNVAASGDNHMWNLVMMYDGLYYVVDITNYYILIGEHAFPFSANTPNGSGNQFLYELPVVSTSPYVHTAHEGIPEYKPEATPTPRPISTTSPEKYYNKITPVGHMAYRCTGTMLKSFYLPDLYITGVSNVDHTGKSSLSRLYDGVISDQYDALTYSQLSSDCITVIDLGKEYDLKAVKFYNLSATGIIGFAGDKTYTLGELKTNEADFYTNWFCIEPGKGLYHLSTASLNRGPDWRDPNCKSGYTEFTVSGSIDKCRYICLMSYDKSYVYCSEIEAYTEEEVPTPAPTPTPTPAPTPTPTPTPLPVPEKDYNKIIPVGYISYICPEDYNIVYTHFNNTTMNVNNIVEKESDCNIKASSLYDGDTGSENGIYSLRYNQDCTIALDLGREYNLKAVKLNHITRKGTIGFVSEDMSCYTPVGRKTNLGVCFYRNWYDLGEKYNGRQDFKLETIFGNEWMDPAFQSGYDTIYFIGDIGKCRYVYLTMGVPMDPIYCSEIEIYTDDETMGFADETPVPTAEPTETPTAVPKEMPTVGPTAVPTVVPSQTPMSTATPIPTTSPASKPTVAPTTVPTEAPTEEPTVLPTAVPTEAPTEEPTVLPTAVPTEAPTEEPTVVPTTVPTATPSEQPTEMPTVEPTAAPTTAPTAAPAAEPLKIEAVSGIDDETGLECVLVMLTEPVEATIAAAQYDANGRLLGIVQVPTNRDETDYMVEMPHEENSTVRVMLWDKVSSIRPLADAVTAE